MDKKFISEDSKEFQELYNEWKERVTKIETIEEFNDFFNNSMNSYNFDYGAQCRVIGLLATAAAWLGANIEFITGFQASFVLWEFIQNWLYRKNKTGLKIVDYDKMLYPQYENRFDKVISIETWEALQAEAEEKLEEAGERACLDVVRHWQSIVDGKVPFGYKVLDKEK